MDVSLVSGWLRQRTYLLIFDVEKQRVREVGALQNRPSHTATVISLYMSCGAWLACPCSTNLRRVLRGWPVTSLELCTPFLWLSTNKPALGAKEEAATAFSATLHCVPSSCICDRGPLVHCKLIQSGVDHYLWLETCVTPLRTKTLQNLTNKK